MLGNNKENNESRKLTQGNQSVNSHITDYLDYYYGLSHAPGFAVLLKGQWGSGKTWFIERYIEKLNKEEKHKCLYISLYGIATLSEIEDKFFQLLHPVLSSKGMAITGIIFKGLLKGALKIDLNSDGKDDGTWNIQIPEINLPDRLKDINKSILIFDDLERCKIDLSNLLGYINYFVEHQDLKVILVANQEELYKNENYSVIKEKLIGKTFSVSPDFEGALESFITLTDNQGVKKFLSDNTELIREVYDCAKYENLRVLRQIILDFERIFQQLPEKAKNKPELLKDFLKILMAFSIEIKRGNMVSKNIVKLEEEYISRQVNKVRSNREQREQNKDNQVSNTASDDNNQESNSLQNIFDKYFFLNLYNDLCPSLIWWQKFFDLGIIDTNELEQSIFNSKYFQDENTPNWVKLWNFYDLSDDNFNTLLKQVKSEYDNKEFSELGEIKHVTGLFLHLSDIGLYSKSKEDILKDARLYIDWLKDNNKLDLNLGCYSVDLLDSITSYKQLLFHGAEFKEFESFCSYIDEVKNSAIEKEMPRLGRELLTIMKDDTGKFFRIICLSNASRMIDNSHQIYAEVPIFKYIESDEFVQQLLLMNFKNQKMCFHGLKKRYEFDEINKNFLEELNWLECVRRLLIEEADSKEGQLSRFLLTLLTKYLDEAIEKLKKIDN